MDAFASFSMFGIIIMYSAIITAKYLIAPAYNFIAAYRACPMVYVQHLRLNFMFEYVCFKQQVINSFALVFLFL